MEIEKIFKIMLDNAGQWPYIKIINRAIMPA